MSSRSASLRWRVTLAFGALGALLSLLFAWATIFITEHYENVLVDGMLGGFAVDIAARNVGQPLDQRSLPQTHTLQGYLRLADGSGDVPPELASLPLGTHEPELGEEFDVRVGVFDLGNQRLYLAINLDDVEPLESDLERILGAIVVFGTLLAAWFGWLFAGRTIAPVSRLAQAVDALPSHAEETRLTRLVGRDELGRLAAAIDSYQARLVQAEARERAFFADASHELRTPLAVVRGTVELLLDDERLADVSRTRLERLDRGMSNLADLLEVLLDLARARIGRLDSVDCGDWLRGVLRELDHDMAVDIEVAQGAERIAVQPREGGLVVRGIARQLNRSGSSARIAIRVDQGELVFTSAVAQSGILEPHGKRNSGDSGLGASLMGRLASQMGWVIDETRLSEGQVRISLPVTTP